ncbi:MAG: hypothetical protein NUW21_03090, partial [Elusimicrobia bacterium]|nr:hypothetical protein [Elusimicrobiota bacterium]
MPVRLLAVLAATLAVPSHAGTARVEVVPELGGLGSAPSASASLSAAPPQLSANALVPAMSLAAPSLTLVAAPVPAAAAAVKPAEAESRP